MKYCKHCHLVQQNSDNKVRYCYLCYRKEARRAAKNNEFGVRPGRLYSDKKKPE